MLISHNGSPVTCALAGAERLADVVERVIADAGGPRALVHVRLPERGDEDVTERLDEVGIADVAAVEIESLPLAVAARRSLVEAAGLASDTGREILGAAAKLRESDAAAADGLAAVWDALLVLVHVVETVANVLGNEATELAGFAREIEPFTRTAAEAQASQDRVRMADVLEYEIAPRLGQLAVCASTLAEART